MYTFTARQLATTEIGHEGQKITFTSQGIDYSGILDSAFASQQDAWVHLIVGADHIVVNDDVIVTVG